VSNQRSRGRFLFTTEAQRHGETQSHRNRIEPSQTSQTSQAPRREGAKAAHASPPRIVGAGLTPVLSPACHPERVSSPPRCHLEQVSPPPTCHLERVSPRKSRKVPRPAVSRSSLPMAFFPGGTSFAPSRVGPPKPKPPSFLPEIFRLRGLGGRSAQDDMWGAVPALEGAMAQSKCDGAMAQIQCDGSVQIRVHPRPICDGCDGSVRLRCLCASVSPW
jgi:hypothetical protein